LYSHADSLGGNEVKKKAIMLLLSCCLFASTAFAANASTTMPITPQSGTGTSVQAPADLSKGLLVNTFTSHRWKQDSLTKLLGKSVKEFDDYVYYPQGVSMKWDENKQAFAVLVEPSYKGEVVKGITTSKRKDEIVRVLGKPHFSDEKLELIGYAEQGYHLFFTFAQDKVKAISIYRRDQIADTKALVDMAKNLQDYGEKLGAPAEYADFSIFGAWGKPDFSYHLRGIGTYAWEYPSRGIAYDGMPDDATLTIYSNFPSKDELADLKNVKNIVFSKEDSLFLIEKLRIETEKEKIELAKKAGIPSPDKKKIAVIDSDNLYNTANIRFYQPDYTPQAQLFPGYFIDEVTWLDNNWILYQTMMGVGVYHVTTHEKIEIVGMEKKANEPFDMLDVNTVKPDLTKKAIVFEVSMKEKNQSYTVRYQITGDKITFTW
jgi:hypothetical protein